MKAVGLYRYLPIDDPESFLDLELDTPSASGRDLLVEVKAISVNPVDTKRRAPKDLVEKAPRVLGWDVAGVVKSAGAEVSLFKPGDAVYYAGSIVRPGGNSEFHLVDERIVGRKPANLGFAEAAALPLTTITAWEGMFDRMGISSSGAHAGKTLLIIAGGGGVGSIAIQLAKKLAGLTVVATALVDTGSRMDELIFQEFKGTGNMELVLDRKLADRRVWPAIDITQSGTRREELLHDPDTLHAVTMLRRTLTTMHHVDAMEQLTKQLGRFKTNHEFIKLISGAAGAGVAG